MIYSKKLLALAFLFFSVSSASGQLSINSGWTWLKGFNTSVHGPVYGSPGVAAPPNKPGSRVDQCFVSDASGNFWMFGGYGQGSQFAGVLGDLWRFDPASVQWTWMRSDSALNTPAIYGSLGVSAPANRPGCRVNACLWTDASGNIWLWGGGTLGGNKADMWKFNVLANEWTWVSGDNGFDSPGVYGTMGVPSAANIPPARRKAVTWSDALGNFWMFGGEANDASFNYFALNDLWRYSPVTNQWTWIRGLNGINMDGTYGTIGTPAPSNDPGGRRSSLSWRDYTGNFWLYGGFGLDGNGALSWLNDLWKFTPATNSWTWMKGDSTVNQVAVYGTLGVPAASNKPAPTEAGFTWVDSSGNLWFYGGQHVELHNALWRYDVASGNWTWMKGSGLANQLPVHGILGISAAPNTPGGRSFGASWTDNNGRFWLFGGKAPDPVSSVVGPFDDVWRLDCLPPDQPAAIFGNAAVCIGGSETYYIAPVPGALTYTWTLPNGWSGTSTTDTVIATPGSANGSITVVANGDCDTSLPQILNVTLHPTGTPMPLITITQGSNPGCLDSLLEFTASSVNTANPHYSWFVNGNLVASGPVYSSNTLQSGNTVKLMVTEPDSVCLTTGTAFSSSITLNLFSTPAAPVIHLIGNMLVSSLSNVQWYGPNGIISNATGQTYHPTEPGQYYAVQIGNGCNSAPSNKLSIALLTVSEYDLTQLSLFPNPVKDFTTLKWGTPETATIEVFSISGQVLLQESVINQSQQTLDLSTLANGLYLLVITNAQGHTGTLKIIVRR